MKNGVDMKRSAFPGKSGQIEFSKGFLCALSISGVSHGVTCVCRAVKLNTQNGCRKHTKNRSKTHASKTNKRTSIITNFGPNLRYKSIRAQGK